MHLHSSYTHYPQTAISCVKLFLLKNFAVFAGIRFVISSLRPGLRRQRADALCWVGI